jgi:hypothetical protein
MKNNQLLSNKNKSVIKNPEIELNDISQNKSKQKILISGSNYQNIVPNVGVRIQEEDKSKTGGLDFKNQFGRMSMKEYELLRKRYAQNNESNSNKNEYNYNYNYNNQNYNQAIETKKWKRSETYDKSNHILFNDINIDNQNLNNQIQNNLHLNSNHIHNMGLKHYDWGSDEKMTMPDINYHNFNVRKNNNYNINSDNNGNKVLNENLFKRSVKKMHSIYGIHNSSKNVKYKINKDSDEKDINNFNNQILQNKNWGSVNNSYKVGRANYFNSIKKSDAMNMRTRKKI